MSETKIEFAKTKTLAVEERTELVKTHVEETFSKNETHVLKKNKDLSSSIELDLKFKLDEYNDLITGSVEKRPINLSIAEYVQEVWGFAPQDLGKGEHGISRDFLAVLGIDSSKNTISSLMSSLPDTDGKRWLVPEILRDAIRLGLRKKPIYTDLIREEINVSSPNIIMPYIDFTAANVKKIEEAETIPVGTITFQDKTIRQYTLATGINVTDKVLRYCTLDLLSIQLEDVGIRIGQAADKLMFDVLINGDQEDGSEAAAVVGVAATGDGITYADIVEALLRMGNIGRTPSFLLSRLTNMKNIMLLPEFKSYPYGKALIDLMGDMKMPQTLQRRTNGNIGANHLIMVDTDRALLKFNSIPLRVDRERIVRNQIEASYVTVTTGFSNINRDGRLILDKSVTIGAAPYPSWMDAEAFDATVLS